MNYFITYGDSKNGGFLIKGSSSPSSSFLVEFNVSEIDYEKEKKNNENPVELRRGKKLTLLIR